MTEAYDIIRREVKEEVLEAIVLEAEAIRKVLDNGLPILHTCAGERFIKICDQRQRLWSKLNGMNKVIHIVLDMR